MKYVITIEEIAGMWVAGCDALLIYGEGKTAPKAFKDFWKRLKYLDKQGLATEEC